MKFYGIGRLGQNPELKSSSSGGSVYCRFGVAQNRKVKGQEITTWYNLTAFNKLAEMLCKYASKGTMLFIEGHLTVEEFTRKDGTRSRDTKLIAESIRLCGDANRGQSYDTHSNVSRPYSAKANMAPTINEVDDYHDIPF
jgi:single-strand DNA-binding protein